LVYLLERSKITKAATFVLLIFILISNVNILIKRWTHPELLQNYSQRRAVVREILRQVGDDEEFALSYITPPGWNFGFQSLFRLYGKEHTGTGAVYTIVIPKNQISNSEYGYTSGDIGIIFPN